MATVGSRIHGSVSSIAGSARNSDRKKVISCKRHLCFVQRACLSVLSWALTTIAPLLQAAAGFTDVEQAQKNVPLWKPGISQTDYCLAYDTAARELRRRGAEFLAGRTADRQTRQVILWLLQSPPVFLSADAKERIKDGAKLTELQPDTAESTAWRAKLNQWVEALHADPELEVDFKIPVLRARLDLALVESSLSAQEDKPVNADILRERMHALLATTVNPLKIQFPSNKPLPTQSPEDPVSFQ
jgi:hypothetical protein